jgi:predicted dehydrogenase
MKLLFVGLGSIGQRHLQNIKYLYSDEDDFFIYALRKSDHNLVIENGKAREVESISDFYGLEIIDSEEEAFELRPDCVFITNPSIYHLDYAVKFARVGSHIFLEKPLSTTSNIEEFVSLVTQKNLVAYVGFQSRFQAIVSVLKESIDSMTYGRLISGRIEWGTYLPSHHKYEDYRAGYAARKELGGGVIFGLSHEIDLVYHLLGMPESIYAVGGQLSTLEMDVEDSVSILMGFEREQRTIPLSLYISYAQTKEIRRYLFQFDKATIIADLMSSTLHIYDKSGELETKAVYDDDRNDLFIREVNDFIEAVRGRGVAHIPFEESVASHKLLMSIKSALNA